MESWLVGELDAELGEAGVDPGVAAVEMRVPEEAGVEDAGEARGERPAHGDAAATVGHGEAVPGVLRRGLGARAEVPRLAPVVPGERVQEVREDERGVVVGEHEPPRRGRRRVVVVVELQELLGDARDADGGGEPARVRVREAGGVGGGDAEAEVGRQWLGRGGGGRRRAVEEEERAHGRAEPEAEQREAERQRAAGGGDAEHHVRQRRRRRRLGRRRRRRSPRRRLVVAPRGGGGGEEGRRRGGVGAVDEEEEEEREERKGEEEWAEREARARRRRRRHGAPRRAEAGVEVERGNVYLDFLEWGWEENQPSQLLIKPYISSFKRG